MLDKHHGRSRVQRVLHTSGYGKDGAARVAAGSPAQSHAGIRKALASVERETRADGAATKGRLDRKPRASGGANKKSKH